MNRADPAAGPRFSIVVPAFQAAVTLAETIDAVIAQDLGDWECLIVDDGSTDATFDLASTRALSEPRIRVIHQENQGTAGAYNTGTSLATGEFIVVCSADDVLLPGHLSAMASFIDAEPRFQIYSSNGYYWAANRSRQLVYDSGRGHEIHSWDLAEVIRICFYSVGATYRRELFESVGGYRLGVFGEDYDFWVRAMASGARHRYLPVALSMHRLSATQKSAGLEHAYRSDIRIVSDLRRDFALSPEELAAVDQTIQDRERLIRELHQPWRRSLAMLRLAARSLAIRVLGLQRARRAWRAVKSVADR
jgi:glycosyltransferase involved in cell wall biosynthesis